MTLDNPGPTQPTTDERELLLAYLRTQRAYVVRSALGLSEDQLRWTPPGGLLPIIGIINHLTHVEWRWIEGRYLAAPFPPREEEFAVEPELTGEATIAAYGQRAGRTEDVVRAAPDLSVPCVGTEGDGPPAHDILGLSGPVDLRWVLLHLIQETARHAGHADSTRELLDGATASDLLRLSRGSGP
jgi:hypothetical protein